MGPKWGRSVVLNGSDVEFLEVLTEGLGPVLLVRGGDHTSKDQ